MFFLMMHNLSVYLTLTNKKKYKKNKKSINLNKKILNLKLN